MSDKYTVHGLSGLLTFFIFLMVFFLREVPSFDKIDFFPLSWFLLSVASAIFAYPKVMKVFSAPPPPPPAKVS